MATDSGELFKKFVELFLFLVVTYMIASEFGRTRERHLKYLMVGFAALVLDKLIMSVVLSFIVFGNLKLFILNPFLPILDLFLEIFALIFLTNAFIFPIFAKRVDDLKRKMTREIFAIIIIAFVIEIFWIFRIVANPSTIFTSGSSYLILELLKILLLFSPIYYILCNYYKMGKYAPHIIVAFAVYMIAPLTNIINIVFFDGISHLRVFAHPFPFIGVLLFTRVIYLKLVDKATLKRELAETRDKYVHEHELSQMKDEFVSTVSHELKTPLTSMKLYLALLKRDKFGPLTKKQTGAVNIVEKESIRLSKLITDILNLSRLEAKKTVLKIERVNLQKLVKDNLYYNLAEQKGITINNNVPKNFMVNVDPDKFKQIFINIFSNAVNYAKSRITISVKDLNDAWQFMVQDDGQGIEADKLDKLFEKFYRVGNYLTKGEKGTGLGLAIVKNIVELHNGTVWVESEVGKGTRFIVSLPK